MTDVSRLVRRAPRLPLLRLGVRESPSDVRERAGEGFPAFLVKERDFAFDVSPKLR